MGLLWNTQSKHRYNYRTVSSGAVVHAFVCDAAAASHKRQSDERKGPVHTFHIHIE